MESAVLVLAPVSAVHEHPGHERGGVAVVSVDEKGALVGVAVAAQHEIDSGRYLIMANDGRGGRRHRVRACV